MNLLGLTIEPTIAMRRGEQAVFQCAQCGTVVVQSSLAPGELGPCPACTRDTWWAQRLPVAGLRSGYPIPRSLDDLATARRDLEDAAHHVVARARREGLSWAAIGSALGVTKQAAAQRFGSVR